MSNREECRYAFIVPRGSLADRPSVNSIEVDRDWQLFRQGPILWGLQSYLILKQRGLHCELSEELEESAINIGHSIVLSALGHNPRCYVVNIQADFDRIPWADCHLVQNQDLQHYRESFWIPLWPQPGLVPRDSGRHGVKAVAFAGAPWHLAGGRASWSRALGKLGVEFTSLGPQNWNDLSGIDVLVGVRRFGRRRYRRGPPSKLINAWHAGVPLVGGWDSAFSQVGSPGVDYLRVTNIEEAVAAIKQLASDKALYARLVEAGKRQAPKYTRDAMAKRWLDVFQGSIEPRYRQWRSSGRRNVMWHIDRVAWTAVNWCENAAVAARNSVTARLARQTA